MSAAESSDPKQRGDQPSPAARTRNRLLYPFLAAPRGPDEIGWLDGYRVIRLLGTGGMGLVFEAEDMSLRRRIALKVLKPELADDPDHRERFLREARAAAGINSDHVVSIYHIVDAKTPYIVMPYLEGESLQTRLEGPNRITLKTALEIARQAAEGLAAAHMKGITHRDVKPANLWLEAKEVPGSGAGVRPGVLRPQPMTTRVKILDFGLARRSAEPSLTSTGYIVGTPNYMSPEQASGTEVDGRADLFSLGAVLYTMLTGEMPFPGNSAMAVMMALANRTPTPADIKNPSVPKAVGDFVSWMMEKDPHLRPQSAREVVAVLDGLLDGLLANVPLPPPRVMETAGISATGVETPIVKQTEAALRAPPPSQPQNVSRRRTTFVWFGLILITVIAGAIGYQAFRRNAVNESPPIVVGILHSQSNTMAVSEKPVIDATLLAIEEINASGGVLGRQLKPVIEDGESDADVFARKAQKLLAEDRAAVIFGCWTSASRKAVRAILQHRNDDLLFYPVQYEGLERSRRIVYLGPAPNQQLLPAIEFLTRPVEAGGLGKKRLFLVGSDYVFPRAAHEIIKDQVKLKKDVRVVGEDFVPFGSPEVDQAVKRIQESNADAIVNTINGSTNVHFFRELRSAGVTAAAVPTLSVSISENEIHGLNPEALAGDYLAASYFESIDRAENRQFLRKFRERFPDSIGSDATAAAYSAVHLWAKAVAKAGTTEVSAVAEACRGLEFEGPRTREKIDPDNFHAWLPVRIGRIRADGRVDLVSSAGSEKPIKPVVFPESRKDDQWSQFLSALTAKWEGKWQPPPRK